jgi:hypothetical protein
VLQRLIDLWLPAYAPNVFVVDACAVSGEFTEQCPTTFVEYELTCQCITVQRYQVLVC